jgi:CRP-like cAMP-binding protein
MNRVRITPPSIKHLDLTHPSILSLRTHARSDFFGEVAILKDQPRSTSAIAANRLVLLSLDRLEFLHLISYGTSSMSGTSIDEEDKRFNEIISKYIGELASVIDVCAVGGGLRGELSSLVHET